MTCDDISSTALTKATGRLFGYPQRDINGHIRHVNAILNQNAGGYSAFEGAEERWPTLTLFFAPYIETPRDLSRLDRLEEEWYSVLSPEGRGALRTVTTFWREKLPHLRLAWKLEPLRCVA
jgi:hypothetical protein